MGTCKRKLSSVLLRKYIISPKYMYWECRWRGYSEMADQAKTPIKIVQSCSNFHRILNLQQWMKLHWSQDLKGDIKDFSFGGVGLACPPSEGVCQIYHNLLYLKPLFNFLHVLKINKDILSTLEHYISEQKLLNSNIVVKWSKIDANQPKPVPNIGL